MAPRDSKVLLAGAVCGALGSLILSKLVQKAGELAQKHMPTHFTAVANVAFSIIKQRPNRKALKRTLLRRSDSVKLWAELTASELKKPNGCIVVGDLNMDLRADAEGGWPSQNTSTMGRLTRRPGGKGANEAVAVARLGVETIMVGRVGNDEHGKNLIEAMKEDGINTDGIFLDKNNVATSCAVIASTSSAHDRPVKYTIQCQGANERFGDQEEAYALQQLKEKSADTSWGGGVMLMHSLPAGAQVMITVAQGARANAFRVVLKAAPVTTAPASIKQVKEVLDDGHVDVLIANEFEAPILLGWKPPCVTTSDAHEAAKALMKLWPKLTAVVVQVFAGCVLLERDGGIKVGQNGVPRSDHGKTQHQRTYILPALHTRDKDVVGAADAFVGGFVAGICHGLSGAQALLWAEGGSRKARLVEGAQAGMPKRDEMLRALDFQMNGYEQCPRCLMVPDYTITPSTFLKQNTLHQAILNGDPTAIFECLRSRARDSNAALLLLRAGSSVGSLSPDPDASGSGTSKWKTKIAARAVQHARAQFNTHDATEIAQLMNDVDAFGATPLQRAAMCFAHVPKHPQYGQIVVVMMMVHSSLLAINVLDDNGSTEETEGVANDAVDIHRIFSKPSILGSYGEFDKYFNKLIGDDLELRDKTYEERAALLMIVVLLNAPASKLQGRSKPDRAAIEIVHSYCELALSREKGTDALRKAILVAQLPTTDGAGHTLLTAAARVGSHFLVKALIANIDDQDVVDLMEKRGPDGYLPLHFACDGNHYETCVQLIVHGADINATTLDGKMFPLDLVHGRDERERFENLRSLGAGGFGAFVSHCKAEACEVAHELKTRLEKALRRNIFLDSDELQDLAQLCQHVQDSDAIVLVQTRHVLTRPWCIIELLTAIDHDIPIVCVAPIKNDASQAYDFAAAQALLQNFEEEVEKINPGAMDDIRKNYISSKGTPLKEALAKLTEVIPQKISKRIDYSWSKRVLDAMFADIIDTVKVKSSRRFNVRRGSVGRLSPFQDKDLSGSYQERSNLARQELIRQESVAQGVTPSK